MKILLIGGSRFVGPILMELLALRGHEIMALNRGRIPLTYTTGVKFIKSNRDNGFSLSEKFDTIIDMCAYTGKQTRRAIQELKFNFFLHMSTAAVYKKTEIFPLTEESPLGGWPVWGEYNRGKVECERVLEKSGVKYAVIRPVYILGPKNYLPREKFIYSKIKNGEPIMLPGNGEALAQFVFAKEVAEALSILAERKETGAFNCAGDESITLRGLVEKMAEIAGEEPNIRFNPNTDGEKFNDSEFPFANENMICDNGKIKALGLKFLPLLSGLKENYETHYKYII